ncbi:MAG: VanZ family protein [Bacteroidales bacterium]|jgi:VanZ family protein|nr:VanZ family protein [Bacteroidales bacterium]
MLKRYRFSILLSLIILVLSLAGPASLERVDFLEMTFSDKLAHTLMYFALMSVISWEGKSYSERPGLLLKAALFTFSYGIIMELLQEFLTNNRTGSFWDAAFNGLGVLLAILAWQLIRIYLSKKNVR